jgi:putative spermidine/putrescine transport system substrate-binding protein
MNFFEPSSIGRALLATAAAVTLALCSVPGVASAQNKNVYLLSWGGTVQSMLEKDGWADRFKEETGYTVTLVPKATSSEIIAAAIAQKSKPQVDVVMCDLPAWYQGKEQDIFATLDPAKLPNLARMVPAAKIGDKAVAPYADVLTIVYNPEMFAKNGWAKPTTISDLARPEFKGKLVIPPVSHTYGMYGLIELARANGGSEENIGPGFEALKKIAPSVVDWTSTHAKLAGMFQQGTVAVALYANASTQDMRARGAPVDSIIPTPSYLSSTVAGIMTNAPNPEGANVLLNWLISKNVLTYRAEKFGNTPLNMDVKPTGPIGETVVQGDQLSKLLQVDYPAVLKNRTAWNERFEREILPIR